MSIELIDAAKKQLEMWGNKRQEEERVCVCMYFCVCGMHHRRPWHTLNNMQMPDDQKEDCYSEFYSALIQRLNVHSIFSKLTSFFILWLVCALKQHTMTQQVYFETIHDCSQKTSESQVWKKIFCITAFCNVSRQKTGLASFKSQLLKNVFHMWNKERKHDNSHFQTKTKRLPWRKLPTQQ